MAKYYDFPQAVVTQRATRAYLSDLRFVFNPPQRKGPTYRVELVWTVTGDNAERISTKVVQAESAQWEGFVNGYAGLPGTDFTEKLLLFAPNLIPFAPAGGKISDDATDLVITTTPP